MSTIPQDNEEKKLENPTKPQIFIHHEPQTHSIMSLPLTPLGGLKFDFITNPLSEIENCSGIIIKQEPEFPEFISGFERNIAYLIFGKTSQGYKYLFKCIEDTGCLNRWFCPTSLRQLYMDFYHVPSLNQMSEQKIVANLIKPYKFPCFGFCRPEIMLYLNETNEKVGTIKEIFACCEEIYEIYDDKDTKKYLIKAKSCQCGLLCSNSIFGPISEACFNIIDPESNEQIGIISKKSPSKSDDINEHENYMINFPEKASGNEKLLITTLGLIIDYQYFEMDPSKM